MASQLRTIVAQKYADRDDLIYDYRRTFFDIFWTDKRYYPNTADEQLDNEIKAALKYIQGTREEITLLTAEDPLDNEGLVELVQEARKVHQSLRFKVRRHYQAKEEGLRVPREADFTKIEEESESSSIRELLMDSLRMLRTRIEDNSGKLNKVRDSRLNALDKAMERVEKQYTIIRITDELSY